MWISPDNGLADDYLRQIQAVSASPDFVIVALLGIFALFHSGLAYLRPQGNMKLGLTLNGDLQAAQPH